MTYAWRLIIVQDNGFQRYGGSRREWVFQACRRRREGKEEGRRTGGWKVLRIRKTIFLAEAEGIM